MKICFFIFGHAGSSLLCGLSLVVAAGGCSLAAVLRLLTAVLRLLTAVAPPVAEYGCSGFSSYGARA